MTTQAGAMLRAATILGAALVSSSSFAQGFPSKPINLVLSSGPGSSVDVMARTLAAVTEKELGQKVIVINKPGGDGAAAMADLLGKRADGHTVWAVTKTFPVALRTTLTQFKATSFQPLVRVQVDPFALAVRADSPYRSLEEFLSAARTAPKRVGGFGSASPHGLFNFRLAEASKTKLTWLPYGAGSEAITALLGGHVDAVVSNPSSMMQQVRGGTMHILAVATETRGADMPDTPTFKESGYDLVDTQWRGLFVKAGTPKAILDRLDAAFRKAIKDPVFQDYLKKTVQEDGYLGPDAFAAFVEKEIVDAESVADRFARRE